MVRAIRGVLVECDPAIKSIIVNIDSASHDFIIEDLDEQRLVINENTMETLKAKLAERLKETQQDEEVSDSNDEEGSLRANKP